MDTADTELVEDEPQYPRQTYVDIEAVNSTLTEVHQQYNHLLLKYSNALNIIDELKCQLACGIGQRIGGARGETYTLGLRRDVHFLDNHVRKREPLPPAAGKRNSDLVTPRQSRDYSVPRRAIVSDSDFGRVLPVDKKQLIATGERTFQPNNNARESAGEIEAVRKPTSSCMGAILDPANKFVSYTANVEEIPSDVGRVLPVDKKQLIATGERTFQPNNNARESAGEIEAVRKPTSSCMGAILDPANKFVSYTANVEEIPQPSSPPCAYDSSRRGHSSHKKIAELQPKYHQVAVVYPARRSAELCTGCCIAHSCCCCQHTAEPQKSIHHVQAPHSSCCYSAGLDAKFTHLLRKGLCSGTSTAPDVALFKVSSALDTALKLAAELKKSSSSLLQQL
ncbi:uncharacterized protein LOC119161206 isoform X2 [Rhipicephalus microplus]|uniref:uncharacterized protein LOC119161206 isoform X2 n=1 Tax=Rhipicephalus microplus TaxID=6941 RepID=UPI001887AC33|nr:uncharacterized protein LOC119161206 isoform X2 [Rhipicephalus microplus]